MQYDKNRFKIWKLPHPLILHWILNPCVIFGELIFGVRVAKVTLIDKESDKPQRERTYVPCPHCETLNDSRLWGKGNTYIFGHWFGLVCPSCHQAIPCLWNIFSLVVLAITFPLWYFPARFFRRRWLEKEKERLAKVLEHPLSQAKSITRLSLGVGVVVWGISIGAGMMSVIVLQVLWNGRVWDLQTMLDFLPLVIVIGSWTSLVTIWTEKDKERLANVPERPLIRAKSINRFESIRWFVRGTFYFGGSMWVALEVQMVLKGREWDLMRMFDILPVCLLAGWLMGAVMYVFYSLESGRKTRI